MCFGEDKNRLGKRSLRRHKNTLAVGCSKGWKNSVGGCKKNGMTSGNGRTRTLEKKKSKIREDETELEDKYVLKRCEKKTFNATAPLNFYLCLNNTNGILIVFHSIQKIIQ
ncbi:hypothetical protein CDAR_481041 [Caerostris darwini]|uniref:Uncharacterized protein n=1 Tax=Caerostris darwini TaxID=1538125 RepID=A0AAV4W5C9_9ARAC|nr:hypothetical protein CDAR_481041 [Caerostris darwini]